MYASLLHDFVVAVVVPKEFHIKSEILKAMRLLALQHKFRPWEIPQDIIVESTPFSIENGLLTPSGKKCRIGLQKKYALQLSELASRPEEFHNPFTRVPEIGVAFLEVAPEVIKNLTLSDLSQASYASISVDSLKALRLVNRLNQKLAVKLSVTEFIACSCLHSFETLVLSKLTKSAPILSTFGSTDWKYESTLPEDFFSNVC